jgi:hypothetical protein
MNEQSFIAIELRDLLESAEFEPFEISLTDGKKVAVGYPRDVTRLSGGFLYYVQDGTRMIVPYDQIVSLHTIFDA